METKKKSARSITEARPSRQQGLSGSMLGSLTVGLVDVIDALPFYAMLVDASHNILLANKAVREHLGKSPEEIIGKYCPKVVHGLDGPFPGCPLEEAVKKGKAVEYEVLDQTSGRWLLSAIYPTAGLTPEGRLVFFHMVTDITDRKMSEERLKTLRQQSRSLSAHLESAREEERTRIAHDLHDEASQVVSSLTAYLEAARYKLPSDASESRAMLEKSRELADRILENLHRLIYELHPFDLHDLGLVPAVTALIDASLEPAGVKVHFETKGSIRRLSTELETVLFRVIQEAFSNIVRHAHANKAEVLIYFSRGWIRVKISDNGRGFDAERALGSPRGLRGFGILSINERIESVGGSWRLRSQEGKGTQIDIEVPTTEARNGPARGTPERQTKRRRLTGPEVTA